jgi:TRAP-type C4-dicarboxylate transport system permease small subunit
MALFLFAIAMMTITFVDVIGRYVFSSLVSGGFKIVQYLMASGCSPHYR